MKLPRLSPVTWVRLSCAIAALVILVLLIVSKKPWDILAEIKAPTKITHYAAIYEWWAGALNFILLVVLGATAPLWMKFSPPSGNRRRTPRWFWPLVLAAMALTTFWGLHRITLSLWDDEESSLRRGILGEYRRDKDGEVKLRETTWSTALWNYKKPANHQFQTVLSKASLTCWRAIARPKGLQFTEAAVRLPCFLAGILSVGALALLLKRLGFPAAGVIAAFALALHPWHVRYAVELRGYIFTVLFGPLMIYFLIQALDSRRWRWWLAFAAAEFSLLYAYPGTLYMAVAANLCAAVAVFLHNRQPAQKFIQLGRLGIASTLAGMLYVQLMLPCLPQLIDYFETAGAHGVLSPRWHHNMGAHLLSGMPWNNSDMAAAGYNELQFVAEAHPVLFASLRAAVLILLALGILRLFVRRPFGWIAAIILLIPGPIVYFVSKSKGLYLYEWYVLFALPGLIGCVALGLDFLTACAGLWKRPATPVLAAAALLIFAAATWTPRQWLTHHPLQSMRESVLLTRPTLDPDDPRQKDIITLSVTGAPLPYDAHLIEIASVDELLGYLRQADSTGKTLYMNFANAWAASAGNPRLYAMIEDDRLFEKTAQLQGFDPTLTFFIRRYKPGSVGNYPVAP